MEDDGGADASSCRVWPVVDDKGAADGLPVVAAKACVLPRMRLRTRWRLRA